MTSPDINGGTVDGAAIGASSASTGAFTTASASTAVKTPLIEYTDGDDAITIADGGGTTFPQAITTQDKTTYTLVMPVTPIRNSGSMKVPTMSALKRRR